MGQLAKVATLGLVGSPTSSFGTPATRSNVPAILDKARLPALYDPAIDSDLPNRVVAFRGLGDAVRSGAPLELSRAFTADERAALDRRIFDLRSALVPAPVSSDEDLRAAIQAMIGGNPNMQRYDDATAYVMASAYLYTVREEPHWAIVEASQLIRGGRAGLNPSFCATEAEFAIVVRRCTAAYRHQLAEHEALLEAKVRPPAPPKPSREEIERMLGDSLARYGLRRTIENRADAIARNIRAGEAATRRSSVSEATSVA